MLTAPPQQMSDERPDIKMSREEHSSLSQLTEHMVKLTGNVQNLTENQTRLEKAVITLGENTKEEIKSLKNKTDLSWDKIGQLILIVLAIVGPCGALLGLLMSSRVAPLERDASVAATERATDHATLHDVREDVDGMKKQRSADHDEFIRTNTAQDIYLSLLFRQEFHADPPTVPLTK